MASVSLPWGTDLQISPTGGLLLVDGAGAVQERIIRRFLTNPVAQDSNGAVTAECDYVFHPTYGGGARRYVAAPITSELKSKCAQKLTEQCLKEPNVTNNPAPVINVGTTSDNAGLAVSASVVTVNGQVVLIPAIGTIEITN